GLAGFQAPGIAPQFCAFPGLLLYLLSRSSWSALWFFEPLYFFSSLPWLSMMPAAISDCRNSSVFICCTCVTTMPNLLSPLLLRFGLLAIASVGTDVPDREDTSGVADADLDVRFFINPAPFPDPLPELCRYVHGPRR